METIMICNRKRWWKVDEKRSIRGSAPVMTSVLDSDLLASGVAPLWWLLVTIKCPNIYLFNIYLLLIWIYNIGAVQSEWRTGHSGSARSLRRWARSTGTRIHNRLWGHPTDARPEDGTWGEETTGSDAQESFGKYRKLSLYSNSVVTNILSLVDIKIILSF